MKLKKHKIASYRSYRRWLTSQITWTIGVPYDYPTNFIDYLRYQTAINYYPDDEVRIIPGLQPLCDMPAPLGSKCIQVREVIGKGLAMIMEYPDESHHLLLYDVDNNKFTEIT